MKTDLDRDDEGDGVEDVAGDSPSKERPRLKKVGWKVPAVILGCAAIFAAVSAGVSFYAMSRFINQRELAEREAEIRAKIESLSKERVRAISRLEQLHRDRANADGAALDALDVEIAKYEQILSRIEKEVDSLKAEDHDAIVIEEALPEPPTRAVKDTAAGEESKTPAPAPLPPTY